ncbi:MAG TPA: polysaccharide deacetylase family protein, partial [Armatimonadota bacterium]
MGESESTPQPPMRPIFYDESQRRWLWLRGILLPLAALFSLAVTLAVIGIGFLGPLLLPYQLKRPAFMADVDPLDVQRPDRRIAKAAFAYKQDRRAVLAERRRDRESRMLRRREVPLAGTAPLSVSAGFYVNWDESSYISLSSHIGDLTHLVPEWLHLAQPKGPGSPSFVDENTGADGMRAEAKVVRLCRERHVPIIPLLNNYLDGWHVAWLSQMLRSPQARTQLVNDLESYLVRKGFQGINIDLENVPESDRDHLSEFMEELAGRFRVRHLLVTQDVPVDDPAFDLPRLGAANNLLIAMLYDEHASDTDAGPIASQSWYRQQLATLFSQVPHDKVVLGLGNYAYDWMKGGSQAHVMTYQDAVVTASESEGVIRYDPVTRNPRYDYYDDNDKPHEVWLLDATTAYNQVELARPQRPAGAALWYVGSEDPSLWSFFGREHLPRRRNPDNLRSVRYGSAVDFEGEGEYLSVVRTETDGHRTLSTDSRGLVVGEKYDAFPSGIVIRRRGGGHKLIALTFDDGPDPRWTPQILDILKQNGVKATFFIVGSVADQNPGLVKRIWREGNELGNHTFTHGNMARMSTARVAVELSATQRLIQSLTGHSSRLFRAPYVADAEPQTPEEVEPILQAQRLG